MVRTRTQAATGNYIRMPFNRCNLGSEQGLIDDPVLGQGRDPLAPLQDVINDEGDIVVPVDPRYLGLWLTGLFGDPDTTDNLDRELGDDGIGHGKTVGAARGRVLFGNPGPGQGRLETRALPRIKGSERGAGGCTYRGRGVAARRQARRVGQVEPVLAARLDAEMGVVDGQVHDRKGARAERWPGLLATVCGVCDLVRIQGHVVPVQDWIHRTPPLIYQVVNGAPSVGGITAHRGVHVLGDERVPAVRLANPRAPGVIGHASAALPGGSDAGHETLLLGLSGS
jgi:hypothetical protein